jgi:LmbE family N-acetylglucosaminyl deacetylase
LQLQIAQYNPDIVVYPDIRDDNPDHSAIGKMMEKILKADPNEITGYAYLVHYKLIWPRPRALAPRLNLTPPNRLLNANTSWEKVPLSQTDENLKLAAINTYKSQLDNPWLHGLLLSSIRRSELLAVPKNTDTP